MDSIEDFIESWIDIDIRKINHVCSGIEEKEELPDSLWPWDEVVDQYEMFILGSVTASIECISGVVVNQADDVDVEDINTSSQREYAHEKVEERLEDIETALRGEYQD